MEEQFYSITRDSGKDERNLNRDKGIGSIVQQTQLHLLICAFHYRC